MSPRAWVAIRRRRPNVVFPHLPSLRIDSARARRRGPVASAGSITSRLVRGYSPPGGLVRSSDGCDIFLVADYSPGRFLAGPPAHPPTFIGEALTIHFLLNKHYESPLFRRGASTTRHYRVFSRRDKPGGFRSPCMYSCFSAVHAVSAPARPSGALDFAAANGDATAIAPLERHLKHSGSIAQTSQAVAELGYSSPPSSIRPTDGVGVLRVALCAQLSNFLNIDATGWLTQFVACFPLEGAIAKRFTCPSDSSRPPPPVGPNSPFSSNAARFLRRARRAPVKFDSSLWNEAMGRVAAGWATLPSPLDARGHFASAPLFACNIASRLCVPHGDKLLGCDDFHDSRTNTAFRVASPIALFGWARSWGNRLACALGAGMGSQEGGSYIRLQIPPIRAGDSRIAVISLRSPTSGDRFGLRPRTQCFGAKASVFLYNCFPRLVTTRMLRIIRLAAIGYFGDPGIPPAQESAFFINPRRVIRFFDILRIPIKMGKSDVGDH